MGRLAGGRARAAKRSDRSRGARDGGSAATGGRCRASARGGGKGDAVRSVQRTCRAAGDERVLDGGRQRWSAPRLAAVRRCARAGDRRQAVGGNGRAAPELRSEEHTSELQSLMRISYAV